MNRNEGVVESDDDEDDDDSRPPPGVCGQMGCMLPNGHMGLCQIKLGGSRRDAVKEKMMVQQQIARLAEIQSSKEIQAQVAIAVRAASLDRAADTPSSPHALNARTCAAYALVATLA